MSSNNNSNSVQSRFAFAMECSRAKPKSVTFSRSVKNQETGISEKLTCKNASQFATPDELFKTAETRKFTSTNKKAGTGDDFSGEIDSFDCRSVSRYLELLQSGIADSEIRATMEAEAYEAALKAEREQSEREQSEREQSETE